jgi:DNA-binding MarR family transcriptional regulator
MKPTCFCLQLRETSRTVCRLYDHYLEQAGVQTGQFGLLCCLKEEPKTINQLSDYLMLDHSTVTRNMQVIYRLNWVVMTPNPADKREKFWQLSDTGRHVYEKAYPLWEKAQASLDAALDELNMSDLQDQLCRLAHQLEGDAKKHLLVEH